MIKFNIVFLIGLLSIFFYFWDEERKPRNHTILYFLLLAFFLLQVLCYFYFTIDDSYIGFRYAQNFAQGKGLVFNLGEKVEGYSNFLWMVILGLLSRLNLGIELTAKILGITFSVLAIFILLSLSRRISQDKRNSNALCLLLLLISPGFGLWAVSGMETALFTFLVTAGVFCYVSDENKRIFSLAPVLFALAAMTRPEGAAFFMVSFLHRLIFRLKEHRIYFKDFIWLASFAVIYFPYFIWRFNYYGYLFPNTVYAKVNHGFQQYTAGLKYIFRFLQYNTAGFLFPVLAIIFVYGTKRRREFWASYLGLIILFYTGFIFLVGGDWMHEFRFFVPILPVAYLIIQEGVKLFYQFIPQERFPSFVATKISRIFSQRLIAHSVFASVFLFTLLHAYQVKSDVDHYGELLREHHFKVAKWLKDNAPPSSKIAIIDIGVIPFVSGCYTIDMCGLADTDIAHKKMSASEKVLKVLPEYIILANTNLLGDDKFLAFNPEEDLIYNSNKFKKDYHLVYTPIKRKINANHFYTFLIFSRK